MTEDEYVESRLDDQIAWYNKKSAFNQNRYKTLRVVEILLATSIPFLTGFISDSSPVFHVGFQVAVGGAGIIIAVISGLLALNQSPENWIEYRTTCESLQSLRFKFLARAQPYDGDDAFVTLVDLVEGLIAKKNRKWAKIIAPEPKRHAEIESEGNPPA
jgi:hypothetical protein